MNGGQKAPRNLKLAHAVGLLTGISQGELKMKLIRKSNKRNKYGYIGSFSIFYCDFCEIEVERYTGNGNKNKSCGCLRMINHKESSSLLYKSWCDMRYRCNRKENKSYKYYGGRGITVCDEWLMFSNFKKWALENEYRERLEIDRIDNDGNYEPSNCRFVTHAQNSRNTRNNKLSWPDVILIRNLYKPKTCTMPYLASVFKVTRQTIFKIIHNEIWIPEHDDILKPNI